MTSELRSRRAHTTLRKQIALKRTGPLTGVYHSILPPSHLHTAVTPLLWRVQWYEQICCARPSTITFSILIAKSYSLLFRLTKRLLSYHILSCPVLFLLVFPYPSIYYPVKSCTDAPTFLSSSTQFPVVPQYSLSSLIFSSKSLFLIPSSLSSSPTPPSSISSS